MTTAKRDIHPAGCGGDGCDSKEPRLLHHLRHRGNFCRLCTSCVLKYHPGCFCCSCFDVLDTPPPSDRPIIHCSKCSSVSHLSCLPNPDLASQFLCPICKNPDGFSFFPLGSSKEHPSDGRRLSIDLSSAKVLLAATTLSAASMSRAAVVAMIDAERKVKEAAVAKKRAGGMLETALMISKKEKEKMMEVIESALVSMEETVEPKKKVPRPSSTVLTAVVTNKRVQSREREKWMMFHQPPIPVAHRPVQGIVENDKVKGPSNVEMKDRVGGTTAAVAHLPIHEEKEGGQMEDAEKGSRIPQSTQDALVSRTNPRAIFTGSPSTASLHS